MTSSSLQIQSDPAGNVDPIRISGCAQLAGSLLLSYDPTQTLTTPSNTTSGNSTSSKTISLKILEGNCIQGSFDSATVSLVNNDDECWRADNAEAAPVQGSLTILFTLVNTGKCISPSTSIHEGYISLYLMLFSSFIFNGVMVVARR